MNHQVGKVILGRESIAKRIEELGKQISTDYRGKEVLFVGILKGAVVFLADLIRAMDIPVKLDFMALSSYGDASASSGVVRILKDLDAPIEGKHVLIVEDILDTGLTLKYLVDTLGARQPASMSIVCLMDKPARRKVGIIPKYVGFVLPDKFVVGYGMDHAENYRNLPDVCQIDFDENASKM